MHVNDTNCWKQEEKVVQELCLRFNIVALFEKRVTEFQQEF
ncbi:hypothetical protein MIDIC_490042 [Alphaproteobacteria bacterium]